MSPPLLWFCCHSLSSCHSCGLPKCCFGHVGAALGSLGCVLPVSLPCSPCCWGASKDEPRGGEGWAPLCSILTYGKLHLELERGLGTAIFAVPHSDFASYFRYLRAWQDLFQNLHRSSICPFPSFCFAAFFPPLQGESCLLWVGLWALSRPPLPAQLVTAAQPSSHLYMSWADQPILSGDRTRACSRGIYGGKFT